MPWAVTVASSTAHHTNCGALSLAWTPTLPASLTEAPPSQAPRSPVPQWMAWWLTVGRASSLAAQAPPLLPSQNIMETACQRPRSPHAGTAR